jgi:hypothetical protein
MTDRLGSDICIIPTQIDITVEDLALLFFSHWYCENGLLKDLISDHNKLFLSKFWAELHKLTGVKLKLSLPYHPKTDEASERLNKTINQCIYYHVHRDQKGWVQALPRIRFDMMNSINASTGFSNFQIHLSRSLYLIQAPFIPNSLAPIMTETDEAQHTQKLIVNLQTDVDEVKNNLLQAKVFQTFYANQHRSPKLPFKIRSEVMLSTLHCRQKFKKKGEKWAAKFFPCYDSLYHIIDTHTASSNYTLELSNSPNTYSTYHDSELKPFLPNNTSLFPSHELP